MKQRLSVPISALLDVGALAAALIATVRDFHLASFIGGVVIAVVIANVYRSFNPTKGHTS